MEGKDYQKLYHKYKVKYNNLLKEIKSPKHWKVGDKLLYKKTNEIVELVKIHYDDINPYYTIKMPDNREKQTVEKLLEKN